MTAEGEVRTILKVSLSKVLTGVTQLLPTLLVAVFSSGCGEDSSIGNPVQSTDSYKFEYCGNIYEQDPGFGGGWRLDSNSVNFLLIAGNKNVAAVLEDIQFPQSFFGCALGDKIEQGFEGYVFTIEHLDL